MRKLLIILRGDRSQEKVARHLGISQQQLSAIERGTRNPSISLMKKFEKYYNRSMTELFPDIFLNNNTTKCSINKSNTA